MVYDNDSDLTAGRMMWIVGGSKYKDTGPSSYWFSMNGFVIVFDLLFLDCQSFRDLGDG